MSRPNILFLMTDQQRFDALGCAGNPTIQTPNLDALASSGVRFANAFTPTPVCVAARMSLITGQRISRHRSWATAPASTAPIAIPIASAAFARAIQKEPSLSPGKLSLDQFHTQLNRQPPDSHASDTLDHTPWETAWRHVTSPEP